MVSDSHDKPDWMAGGLFLGTLVSCLLAGNQPHCRRKLIFQECLLPLMNIQTDAMSEQGFACTVLPDGNDDFSHVSKSLYK